MVQKHFIQKSHILTKIAASFLVILCYICAPVSARANFFDDVGYQLADGARIVAQEIAPAFFNPASLVSVFDDIKCFFGIDCKSPVVTPAEVPNPNDPASSEVLPGRQITNNIQYPNIENNTAETKIPNDIPDPETKTRPSAQIIQNINPTKEIQTIHTVNNNTNTNTVIVDQETKNQVARLLRQLNSDRPNYSTGQSVSLPANLTSKTLTISSGAFNVDENGNATANNIIASNDLTVQGNFTVSGSQTYSGAASFTATSTVPALLVEQTGSGNAFQADNVTVKNSTIGTDDGGILKFHNGNNYLDANGNLVLGGDITGGKYNGLTINPTTKTLTVSDDTTISGTNTGDQTITLTGDITGSGTGSFAAAIGNSKVTNAMLAGSISSLKLIGTDISTLGTVTAGVWNGTVITPQYGGTGVANNASNTITFTGNYSLGLTLSGTTSLVLPTSGTLATLAGAESLTNKKLGSLTSNGFVKTSGGDGTLSVDTATYLNATGSTTGASSQAQTFTTGVNLSNLTQSYVPYASNESKLLGNSGIYYDGSNVGIGTTNPASKLTVSGDIRIASGSGGQIVFADGSTMASSGLGSAAALSATGDAIVTGDSDTDSSGDVILKTGSNDRLHILNNGNVGIGTASPSAKLEVRGGIKAGTNGTEFVLSSDGAVAAVTYNGLTLTSQATGFTIAGGTSSKTLTLNDDLNASAVNTHLANTGNPHSVTQTQIGLSNVENTALSTWAGTTNVTTLGTVAAGNWNGSVISPQYGGTGVANNAASTLTISGNYAAAFTLSNTTSLTLPVSGTLATLAGSESLTNKKLGSLTVNGFVKTSGGDGTLSVDTSTYLNSTGATTGATSQAQTFTNGVNFSNLTQGYVPYASNASKLLGNSGIYYDGSNVGIGTAAPGYKLNVNGSLRAQTSINVGFNIETLSADKTLTPQTDKQYQYLDPNGANRSVTLATTGAIAGDRFIVRNNGTYTIFYYLKIYQSSTLLDYVYAGSIKEFVFDGTNWVSGENGSGEDNDRKNNVAIGSYARGYSFGTAVGYSARGNTYGAALGYGSYGFDNGAAVGYDADGSSNGAVVGYNTLGYNNGAAVGRNAIGSYSGVAMGYYARGMHYGAAFGYLAGGSLNMSSDLYNNLFGAYAGYRLTTGAGNLIMGYQSGYDATYSPTTGSNNILMGYQAGTPSNSTSNFLNIGNAIFATGINNSAFPAISAANVGIGTTNPSYPLDIAKNEGNNSPLFRATNLSSTGAADFNLQNDQGNNMFLQMSGSAYVGAAYYNQAYIGTNGSDVAGLTIETNGSEASGGTTPIYFQSGGYDVTPQMTILPSGNVGIGTTAPGGVLETVASDSANLVVRGTAALGATSGGGANLRTSVYPTAADQRLGQISFGATDGTNAIALTKIQGFSNEAWSWNANAGSYLTFSTTPTGAFTTNERMRINSSGNVGIGTTNPGAKLDVEGGGLIAAGAMYLNGSSVNTGNTSMILSNSTTGGEIYSLTSGIPNVTQSGFSINRLSGYSYGASIQTIATPIFTISGNNVGIGTFSPSALLNVTKTHDAGTTQEMFRANFDANWGLRLVQNYAGTGDIHYEFKEKYASTEYDVMAFKAGNVGIGTTAPANNAKLTLNQSGATNIVVRFENANGGTMFQLSDTVDYATYVGLDPTSHIMWFGADTTNKDDFVIKSDGNVGIGTAAPTGPLQVHSAGTYVNARFTDAVTGATVNDGIAFGYDDSYGGIIWNREASNIILATSNTEKVRIDSAGNVGIGTTNPQQKFHVYRSTDGAPVRFEDSNGYCEINPTTTTWTCSSDITMKKDIVSLSGEEMLNKVNSLQGVNFHWKTQTDNTLRYGFIAQEVEKIFPEFVNTDEKGLKSVAYGAFTPVLVEAIKAQQNQIEELKLTLNGFGLLNSSSTVDMAVFHSGGLGAVIKDVLQSLGMALQDGVASLKEVVVNTLTAKQVNTGQMCVKDSGNNDVCLNGDQLKELIQRSGSSVTINQNYQPPVVPMNNATATAP